MKNVKSGLLRSDSGDKSVKQPDKKNPGGISRRDFIVGTVSMVVAPGFSASGKLFNQNQDISFSESGSTEAMTIIDTHTHFFDPTRAVPEGRDRPVPWPTPGSPLYKKTLPPEWETLAKPLGMRGTIVVEAGTDWLEDNDWILMLAEQHRSITGLIGNLSGTAIRNGSTVPVWGDMNRFRQEVHRLVKNSLFLGIRVGGTSVSGDRIGRHYPHFEVLADEGLVIDVLGVPVADILALTRVVSSLTIVADHMFSISDTASPPDHWKSDITALSEIKNVVMKVSGLVEGLDSLQTDSTNALSLCRDSLDHVYNSFGPDRLVFGTNWPVSNTKGEISVVTDIVRKYFETKGMEVLVKVFAGNAKKVYRFVDR